MVMDMDMDMDMDTLDTKINYIIGTLLVIEYNRELKSLARDLRYDYLPNFKFPRIAKLDLKRILSQTTDCGIVYDYYKLQAILLHPDMTISLINEFSVPKELTALCSNPRMRIPKEPAKSMKPLDGEKDIYTFIYDSRSSVELADIYKYPEIFDRYPSKILYCTDITWDIIKQLQLTDKYKYITKPGSWMASYHWFCWDIVLQYPEVQWDWKLISSHPNITWDIILANDTNPNWIRKSISMNPNITWDIVQANPERPWNISKLSGNPNITMEIVLANPGKCWNYTELSSNPSLLWDDIRQNPDKPWEMGKLFNNEYTKQSNLILQKHRKRVNQRINFMNRYVTLFTIKTALEHYKLIDITVSVGIYWDMAH